MKALKLTALVVSAVLAGCAGGVGKLDMPGGGETTESIELAKHFAEAVKDADEKENPCESEFTPEQIIQLKEQGQVMLMVRSLVCESSHAMAEVVKAARGLPTTAAGEVAHAGAKAIQTTEQTDAEEQASNTNMVTRVVTGGLIYGGIREIARIPAGDTINANIQQSNSINGSEIGGMEEGMLAENGVPMTSGDRSNVVNIKSNDFDQTKSTSSAMAATANGDKPTAQEGPATGNNTLNDQDDVSTDTGINF